jgi:hypothetical protein
LSKEVKKGSKKSSAKEQSKRKLTPRQAKFTEGVLRHGNATKAALDAGYSPKTARVIASQNLTKLNIQERVKARVAESQVETNEIIGTFASQMRGSLADIAPEDELLKAAKERGVDHLIKKLKVTTRLIPQKGHDEDGNPEPPIKEVTHEFELYSAQEAAKQLAGIKGLMKELAKNPEEQAREAYSRLVADFKDIPAETIRQRVAERYGVQESVLIH